MVKDIFFAATNGIRNSSNYPEGMWVIEMISKNNSKGYIQALWDELDAVLAVNVRAIANRLLRKLVDSTVDNTSGVNGYTQTSRNFHMAAWRFLD